MPAHDERDFEFAQKYKLPVFNADLIDKDEAIKKANGKKTINYKLKDWVFSRQRYWGEPIPLIHCEKCGVVPVPEKGLPVKLPKVKFYEPTDTGESPLAKMDKWVNVKCPRCGGKGKGKPTPCLNGRDPLGIIFVTLIRKIKRRQLIRKRKILDERRGGYVCRRSRTRDTASYLRTFLAQVFV